MDKDIIAISGPSAIGKGTAMSMLKDEFGDQILIVPKVTTRNPRPGEADASSSDYMSFSPNGYDCISGIPMEHFIAGVNSGDIVLEHQPFPDLPNLYGYRRGDFHDQSGLKVFEPNVEHQLQQIKARLGDRVYYLAMTTDNLAYIASNLAERGTEKGPAVIARLKEAQRIMGLIDHHHMQEAFDEVMVMNDSNRHLLQTSILDLAGKLLVRS